MDEHEVPLDDSDHGVVRDVANKGLWTEFGMGSKREEPTCRWLDKSKIRMFPCGEKNKVCGWRYKMVGFGPAYAQSTGVSRGVEKGEETQTPCSKSQKDQQKKANRTVVNPRLQRDWRCCSDETPRFEKWCSRHQRYGPGKYQPETKIKREEKAGIHLRFVGMQNKRKRDGSSHMFSCSDVLCVCLVLWFVFIG